MRTGIAGNTKTRVGRGTVVAAMAVVALGATTACTAEPAAEADETSATIAVTTGQIPNQDVIELYTGRDEAIDAAIEAIPAHIEEAMEVIGVPGLAVAVVSDGEIVYEDGFGVRDNTTSDLVDPETVFQIASLSKPISATIIAKAMTEDPELTWSTPVSELMPDFRMADPYVTEHAEIGDYFSHRTGIPTGGGDDLEDVGFDREYILDRLELLPLYSFRNTYHYSNFGITAGAQAVAVSRGQTWEQTADELLFEPLGMTSTSASHDDYLAAENRAVLHARTGPADFEPLFDREPDAEAPAGGVASTVGDVAEWMALVLADGELDGAEYVSQPVLAEAFSAVQVKGPNRFLDQRAGLYGMGMNVGSAVGGRVTLNHSGAFGLGAATTATMVPDLDLGIVVLTNGSPSGLPETVASEFLDLVMYGHLTRDWVEAWQAAFDGYSNPYGDLVGEAEPEDAAPAGPAADYVGTYTNDYFGEFTVTERGGELVGALGPDGVTTFPLTPWDGDTMAMSLITENSLPGSVSSVQFVRDGGRITGVTLTRFNSYPPDETQTGLGVFTRAG